MAERHPRMIVSTEGLESSGKTRFALSAPRPIAYLDFDYGVEGVQESTAPPPEVHEHYDLLAAAWQPEAAAKRHAQDVMRKFIEDFRKALAAKMRTVVADTFTAAWAGQRLARGGEGGDSYVEYEEEFRSLIRAAYASPHTNVILIHHLARDWKRNKDGKAYKGETYSRDGMDGIATMVQLAIRQRYVLPQIAGGVRTTDGRFEIDVLKSRDNIGLTGATMPGMDFPTLCAMVAPSIDWSR